MSWSWDFISHHGCLEAAIERRHSDPHQHLCWLLLMIWSVDVVDFLVAVYFICFHLDPWNVFLLIATSNSQINYYIAMVEELANEYAQYLRRADISNEVTPIIGSIDQMLNRLDEFESLMITVRNALLPNISLSFRITKVHIISLRLSTMQP